MSKVAAKVQEALNNVTQAAGLLDNAVAEGVKFFHRGDFEELHRTVLTVNWFAIAFLAILIAKKFPGVGGRIGHILVIVACNVSTLFVNFGALYRTYPKMDSFSQWSLPNKAYKVGIVVFTLLLLTQILAGVKIIFGGSSSFHKRFGPIVHSLGMLLAIGSMLMARLETRALVFAVLFLVEVVIVGSTGPKVIKSDTQASSAKQNLQGKKTN